MEKHLRPVLCVTRLAPVIALATVIAAIVAGCSKSSTVDAAAAASSSAAAVVGSASSKPASAGVAIDSAAANTVASRELVNPDASTVVLLYYELAHLPIPIDTWVEEDTRVRFAPAPEKAAKREAIRSELYAAAAAVKGIGALRLTMNANLSDYDPSYGEFTIRALSPSSVIQFDALGQKVAVNFANGRTAQIWRVPQAEAQGVRDKIAYNNVEVDALLRVRSVLPGSGGGTIATDVLEYELRESQHGTALARVKLQEQR